MINNNNKVNLQSIFDTTIFYIEEFIKNKEYNISGAHPSIQYRLKSFEKCEKIRNKIMKKNSNEYTNFFEENIFYLKNCFVFYYLIKNKFKFSEWATKETDFEKLKEYNENNGMDLLKKTKEKNISHKFLYECAVDEINFNILYLKYHFAKDNKTISKNRESIVPFNMNKHEYDKFDYNKIYNVKFNEPFLQLLSTKTYGDILNYYVSNCKHLDNKPPPKTKNGLINRIKKIKCYRESIVQKDYKKDYYIEYKGIKIPSKKYLSENEKIYWGGGTHYFIPILIFLAYKHRNAFILSNYIKKINFHTESQVLIFDPINSKYIKNNYTQTNKEIKDIAVKNLDINKRFIVVPVIITNNNGKLPHFNVIFVDKYHKKIEVFEPNYIIEILKEYIEARNKAVKFISNIYKGYKIETPTVECTTKGCGIKNVCFQDYHELNYYNVQEDDSKQPYEQGFCALWGLWFVDLRLANPDIDIQSLMNLAMKYFQKSSDTSIHNYMRSIGLFYQSIVHKYNKSNKDLNVLKELANKL